MSKEGISVDNFDPKPAIRRNAENARDWEFHEEAEYLYGMAVLFRDRLIDPIARIDRSQMPDPVISFDTLRKHNTLAAYTLNRNAQGLLDEITFNTTHYIEEEGKPAWRFGRWAQLETLLHEQVHLWQERVGQNKHKPGRVSHDREFVAKCESLGLHPLPVKGSHYMPADGVFAVLMGELGIKRTQNVADANINIQSKTDWFRPDKEKGRSTLTKWVCPHCNMAVRMGIKDDPMLVHDTCSLETGEKVFLVRHDDLTHTIYDGNR